MTAYGEPGRQVVGAVDAPYTTEIIRSMALSSAELWHDVLQRLAEVQEGQILIAQAVAQLGAVVADLSAKVDLPPEIAALATQGQEALATPVQGALAAPEHAALGAAVEDDTAPLVSSIAPEHEAAEGARRRFFRHGRTATGPELNGAAAMPADDDEDDDDDALVIDEAHLVSGEPIADETVVHDELAEHLVLVMDETDLASDDESPVVNDREFDDQTALSPVVETAPEAMDVAAGSRRHRFHLRRHLEVVDEPRTDDEPLTDDTTVAAEIVEDDDAPAGDAAAIAEPPASVELEIVGETSAEPGEAASPEPRRHRLHLRRRPDSTRDAPAAGTPVVGDELVTDEAGSLEMALVVDEVSETEAAPEISTVAAAGDEPAEPKRGHFHLRRHHVATTQEPAPKPAREKRAKAKRGKRGADVAAVDSMTASMAEPEVAEAPVLDSVPLPPPPLVTPPPPVPPVTPPPVTVPVLDETAVPLFAEPHDHTGRLGVVAQLEQLDDAANAAEPERQVLVADHPEAHEASTGGLDDPAPLAPVGSTGPALPQALVYTPATAETARTEPASITLDPVVEEPEPVDLQPEPVDLQPEPVVPAVDAVPDAEPVSEEPVLAGVGAAVQSSASMATEILSTAPAPNEAGPAAADSGPLVISPDVTLISKNRKRRLQFRR